MNNLNARDLTDNEKWANGCGKCDCGLLIAPEVKGSAFSLVEMRKFHYRQGLLVFCDCRAGKAYERHLASLDKIEPVTKPVAETVNLVPASPDMSQNPLPNFRYDGHSIRGPKDD